MDDRHGKDLGRRHDRLGASQHFRSAGTRRWQLGLYPQSRVVTFAHVGRGHGPDGLGVLLRMADGVHPRISCHHESHPDAPLALERSFLSDPGPECIIADRPGCHSLGHAVQSDDLCSGRATPHDDGGDSQEFGRLGTGTRGVLERRSPLHDCMLSGIGMDDSPTLSR